jgi:hypothetical protein
LHTRCGNWGLEARHRQLKRHWRVCWRGGSRKGSGSFGGAADLLAQANATMVTSPMVFAKKRRRHEWKEVWLAVKDRVRELVMESISGPAGISPLTIRTRPPAPATALEPVACRRLEFDEVPGDALTFDGNQGCYEPNGNRW